MLCRAWSLLCGNASKAELAPLHCSAGLPAGTAAGSSRQAASKGAGALPCIRALNCSAKFLDRPGCPRAHARSYL